jgi:CMP-N-acetylneuraminic acid synthetase
MLSWAIRAAKESKYIDDIILTTDSPKYREIALKEGALCPRLRSANLATDEATSSDVVIDVLTHMLDDITKYQGMVLLQPTSPLRTATDIDGAISMHKRTGADAVVSVSDTECSPILMGQLDQSLKLEAFPPRSFKTENWKQSDQWCRINGAIYVECIEKFMKTKEFIPEGALAYKMPRERSVDVDTEYDFKVASLLMAERLSH